MKTIEQIRQEGFDALLKTLGPADTIRFMQQFDTGRGDYTKERHTWLDNKSFKDLTSM